MRSTGLKKGIAGVVAVLFSFSVYYGSYLPLKKSLVFIAVLRDADRIKSLQDFGEAFSVPLEIPSPIGQEELVRNVGSNVVGIVQQTKEPRLIEAAIQYLDVYYKPIIDGARGTNFTQNLFMLGSLHENAFRQTQEVRYLHIAEEYYERGLALSPKRPQFLYSLFGVYRMQNKVEEARKVGEQILAQWPSDEQVQAALATLQ